MPNQLLDPREPRRTEIPDKLYFRIGEVARLCKVQPYVLRFWESEFPQLKPNKSGTGQRLYRKRDVEMAMRIKRLLYDEGYTIAGARHAVLAEIRSSRTASQPELPLEEREALERSEARISKVRKELREILMILSVQAPHSAKPGEPPQPAKGKLANSAGTGLFES